MLWGKAIENYRTFLVLEKSLSENSVGAYLNDINKLRFYCETNKLYDVDLVTHEILESYFAIMNQSGITNRTQARTISSFRSFFKFLVYDNTITKNPAQLFETPKIGRALPNVLSVEEIERILKSVDLGKIEGQRNKAIIETLYSCGLRVSELVNLKISNLDFKTGIIRVDGKGNKERIVPITQSARYEITRYINTFRNKSTEIKKGNEDVLFLSKRGSALSRVMIFNIIKGLATRAGINKSISPHTFRHSFASHLVNGGADLRAVQDMLGHESIITTEIYTHLNNTYLEDTINNYHPRVRHK